MRGRLYKQTNDPCDSPYIDEYLEDKKMLKKARKDVRKKKFWEKDYVTLTPTEETEAAGEILVDRLGTEAMEDGYWIVGDTRKETFERIWTLFNKVRRYTGHLLASAEPSAELRGQLNKLNVRTSTYLTPVRIVPLCKWCCMVTHDHGIGKCRGSLEKEQTEIPVCLYFRYGTCINRSAHYAKGDREVLVWCHAKKTLERE